MTGPDLQGSPKPDQDLEQHDPLCRFQGRPSHGSCDCALIAKVRADERERLRDRAATATVTAHDDGMATLAVDDPHGIGWAPVSTDLIRALIEQRNSDAARIQADERAKNRLFSEAQAIRADERKRIAQAIEALEIRLPWGPFGSEMVGRSDAARIARNGGRDE